MEFIFHPNIIDKNFAIQFETLDITFEKINPNEFSIKIPVSTNFEIYERLFISLRDILMLASGQNIISNRQIYNGKTVQREMVEECRKGYLCIAPNDYSKLIKMSLNTYNNKNWEYRNIFYFTTRFLNCTNSGFIDDRASSCINAWESYLSFDYPKIEIPQDLLSLKKILYNSLTVFEDTSENNKEVSKTYEIRSSLSRIFKSTDLLTKYQAFMKSRNFKPDFLNHNFLDLKKMRDQNTHMGYSKGPWTFDQKVLNSNNLYNTTKALQINMLRDIGYMGEIYFEQEDKINMISIGSYFLS